MKSNSFKRLVILVLSITLVMAVASCSNDTATTPDTVAPVFSGVKDVTVAYDSIFTDADALEGVTATDDVDGDLTSAIEVVNPVDTSDPGEYTVTFTVADTAGNVVTASMTVTVSDYTPAPTTVEIAEGPAEVVVPLPGEEANTATYVANVLDQYDNVMADASAELALQEAVTGVSIADGVVTVTEDAEAGTFTVVASNADVETDATLEVILVEQADVDAATAAEVEERAALDYVESINLTVDVDSVNIAVERAGELTLKSEDGFKVDGDLTVTAPNLTFTNEVSVTGTVTIEDVAASTWNENAEGNTIVWNAVGDTININNTVASATFNVAATVTGGSNIQNAVIKDNGVDFGGDNPQDVDEDSEYDAYIAEFKSITVAEESEGDVSAQAEGDFNVNVNFEVFDQFGVNITDDIGDNEITVEGNIDGMSVDVTNTNIANGEVSIRSADLIEGKLLTLDFTAENGDGDVTAEATFKYNFDVEDEPVATTIKEIEVDSAEIEIESSATLTAKVFDQYGSEFTKVDEYLRWQITEGFDDDIIKFGDLDTKTTDDDEEVTVNANSVGTAEVTVFIIANGVEVEQRLSLTVTPKALTDISLADQAPTTEYNQETVRKFKVNPVLAGAVLDKDAIGYEVVDTPADATASDISVSFVEEEGDIYAEYKTLVAGSYDIKVTHENPTEGEDAFEAVATITTTLNPNVTSITFEAVEVNEVTESGTVYKEVSFFNKHNEEVEVAQKDVSLSTSNNLSVEKYQANEDNEPGAIADTASQVVKFVGITANADTAGESADVTVASNGKTASINFEIAAASELTSMALDSNSIEIITDDSLDAEEPADDDNIVVINSGNTYKLIPVTFYDQYGNEISAIYAAANYTIKDSSENDLLSTNEVIFVKSITNDTLVNIKATDEDTITHIGFHSDSFGNLTADDTVTITLNDGTDDIDTADVNVAVKDARELASLAADPDSAKMVVDADSLHTISGKDQYGRDFTIDYNNVVMVAASDGEYTASVSDNGTEADVTITAIKTGSFDAVVYYDANTNGKLDSDEISVTVSLTIEQAGDAIASIDILPEVTMNSTSMTEYTANVETYNAKAVKRDADNTYTFVVKAYNSDGEEVATSSSDFISSIVDNSLENVNDVSISNNVLTIDDTTNDGEVSGTITLRATSVNGKTDEITLTLDSSVAAPLDDTYYLADSATGSDALTSITLDEDESHTTNGVREVYLVAIDQYGQKYDVDETILGIGLDSSEYFTAPVADPIVITAKAAGTTNMRVFVDNNNTVVVPVTVLQNAVDAL